MSTFTPEEENLKQMVLGLVLGLVQAQRDAVQLQAMRMLKNGTLTGENAVSLQWAVAQLDEARDRLKDRLSMSETGRPVPKDTGVLLEELWRRSGAPGYLPAESQPILPGRIPAY